MTEARLPVAYEHRSAPRERLRPFTWVIIAVNIVIVLLSIALYVDYHSTCDGIGDCPETKVSIFGWILLDGFVLTFVNIALGVLWLLTKRRRVARGAVPPQWVVDPNDPGVWRWWDGRAYTHHTAPRSG